MEGTCRYDEDDTPARRAKRYDYFDGRKLETGSPLTYLLDVDTGFPRSALLLFKYVV